MSGALAALGAGVALALAVLVLPARFTAERFTAQRFTAERFRADGVTADGVRSVAGRAWPTGRPRGWSVRTGRSTRRRRAAGEAQLVVLLDLLVPALRAGLPVAAALGPLGEGAAGTDLRPAVGGRRTLPDAPGWVAAMTLDLRSEAAAGRPLARVWAAHASAAESREGAFVARAWALSETLGSPLAEAVAEAGSAVRQRIARGQRLEVAVAGPSATARVLTLLPMAGPLVAMAMGMPPLRLYSGVGGVCALVGLLLALGGRLWCARLLQGVARPMTAAELG